MDYPNYERWSRGCGNGIDGPSQHALGSYRAGVLEDNWVEDRAGIDLARRGLGTYNHGARPRMQSLQHEEYTAAGKTGRDLAYVSQRHDRDLDNLGQTADTLLRHGSFRDPPLEAHASLNTLVYGEKHLDEPKVQAYLWTDRYSHNRTVPVKVNSLHLTHKAARRWRLDHESCPTYQTSSRSASFSAALHAAEQPTRTATLRPGADGGQASQVGRKPVGPHQQECEKNYRRTGLRDTWCTFLTAPKH